MGRYGLQFFQCICTGQDFCQGKDKIDDSVDYYCCAYRINSAHCSDGESCTCFEGKCDVICCRTIYSFPTNDDVLTECICCNKVLCCGPREAEEEKTNAELSEATQENKAEEENTNAELSKVTQGNQAESPGEEKSNAELSEATQENKVEETSVGTSEESCSEKNYSQTI